MFLGIVAQEIKDRGTFSVSRKMWNREQTLRSRRTQSYNKGLVTLNRFIQKVQFIEDCQDSPFPLRDRRTDATAEPHH